MHNDSNKSPLLERVEQEASAWVLRADRGLTATEQDELSVWLAADPLHGVHFARFRSNWRNLDALGQWRPEHSATPNPDLLAPAEKRRFTRFVPMVLSLAVAASVVLGMFFWRSSGAPRSEGSATAVSNAPGNSQQRILEDGSVVDLDQNAIIKVTYSPSERRVQLLQGEAYFTVSKNPARPFIVTAGKLDVRAVGTAFSVRMTEENVKVLVTEGHVKLISLASAGGEKSPAARNKMNLDELPVLSPNQEATVSLLPNPAPLQIATRTSGEIGMALAWQHRLLDFNAVPLSEVVLEFNRRNRVQMIVVDEEFASIPISASFRSDNVEGFLRLLEAGFGARVERRGDIEILLSRKP
jgi:transmembrane sensor